MCCEGCFKRSGGGEAERDGEYPVLPFATPRSFLFPLLFFYLQKKKNINSYRVRPEQHLPGEAVALLRQRDVADSCFLFFFVVLKRVEENDRGMRFSFPFSKFFSSTEKHLKKTRFFLLLFSLLTFVIRVGLEVAPVLDIVKVLDAVLLGHVPEDVHVAVGARVRGEDVVVLCFFSIFSPFCFERKNADDQK